MEDNQKELVKLDVDFENFVIYVNGKNRVQIVQNDITAERVDAITNAANNELWYGAGVAGAIRKKGGPKMQAMASKYVKKHGEVPTGGAGCTVGGNLIARYVI